MSHGPVGHQTTTIQALMSLLKGYIGTGILAMPKAFSDSGYVLGIIGTVIIGILCNCCIHMLVEINELFCSKPDEPPFDYEELAQISFENGPKKVRKYAKTSKTVLMICLFLTQLGFCCAYALFIAKNLLQFAINLKIGGFGDGDVKIFLLILLPVMIMLNFVKSIRHLAMGSTFANVVQLTSLIIIAYNLVTKVPDIADRKPIGDKLPQFVSTTVFTYEGITVTMPLYRSMKRRQRFGSTFGVINLAIICVIILYCSMGFLGYLKYGEGVGASISLSLPNEPIYEAVQLMYALAITLSYPLQMYVAIHLVWPLVKDFLCSQQRSTLFVGIAEYVVRALLVVLTFIMAAFIPELDLVIELIGAFSCSAVAIIIPTILHLVTFSNRRTGMEKAWLFFKDLLIMGLGLLAFTTGTYYSIHDIINRLSGNDAHSMVPHLNATTTFANVSSFTISNFTSPSVWLENNTTPAAALFTNSTL